MNFQGSLTGTLVLKQSRNDIRFAYVRVHYLVPGNILAYKMNKTLNVGQTEKGSIDDISNVIQIYIFYQVTALEMRSDQVENASSNELDRQEAFQITTDQAYQEAVELNKSTPAIIDHVTYYKNTADQVREFD